VLFFQSLHSAFSNQLLVQRRGLETSLIFFFKAYIVHLAINCWCKEEVLKTSLIHQAYIVHLAIKCWCKEEVRSQIIVGLT